MESQTTPVEGYTPLDGGSIHRHKARSRTCPNHHAPPLRAAVWPPTNWPLRSVTPSLQETFLFLSYSKTDTAALPRCGEAPKDQIPPRLPYYKIPDYCKRNLLSTIMHCEEYYWILSFIYSKIKVAGNTFSGKLLLINSKINISLLGWIFSGKCYPLESMFSHTYIFKVLSKVTIFFIPFFSRTHSSLIIVIAIYVLYCIHKTEELGQ